MRLTDKRQQKLQGVKNDSEKKVRLKDKWERELQWVKNKSEEESGYWKNAWSNGKRNWKTKKYMVKR